MPAGTRSTYNDRAPEQSPVLVELSLQGAVSITFSAAGKVEHAPYQPPEYNSPDGGDSWDHYFGEENGISNIKAPINSLLGVFLTDDRPDRSRAPRTLTFRDISFSSLSPQLKQLFFIGTGSNKAGAARRIMVPKGATRLYLGIMDGYEWNNNQGEFTVTVTIERSDVSSNMFSVDSRLSFAEWHCLPDRRRCTPEHAIVKDLGGGRYHIVLPAHLEWGASIPAPKGTTASMSAAAGTVCLDAESRCSGPAGTGDIIRNAPAGALISKTSAGKTWFSVNDRSGAAFRKHEGYFEFEVEVK
jgi:hypothetical protein